MNEVTPIFLAQLSNGQYVCLLSARSSPTSKYLIEYYKPQPSSVTGSFTALRSSITAHHLDTATARYLQLLASHKNHGINYTFLTKMPFRARMNHVNNRPISVPNITRSTITVTTIDF